MYGMIHQAARDLALARLGRDEWEALVLRSGLTDRHFIGVDRHSDAQTLQLVSLIAERLGCDLDETLHEFGRFWIDFAETSVYRRAMWMIGGDLESVIANLDRMHASIASAMPEARMPHFELISADAEKIRFLYRSERPGFAPFLNGILCATAERFGETVRVTHAERSDGVLFVIERTGHGL